MKRKPGRPPKTTPDVVDADGFAPNLDVLGECCGVDRKTIDNARRRFARTAPKKRADGRYCVASYKAWLLKHGVSGRRKDAELEHERDIKLAHSKLNLDRARFEFERIKDRMLPAPQFEAALAKMLVAFLGAIDAFGPRINEQLDGLDYDDRALVIAAEVLVLKKTLASCDYLAVEEEEDE